MTPEEEADRKAKISAASRAYWANLTPEDRKRRLKNMHVGTKARWDSKTPEERSRELSECTKKGWANIDADARKERLDHMRSHIDREAQGERSKAMMAAKPLEEKQERARHMRESVSDEQRSEIAKKIAAKIGHERLSEMAKARNERTGHEVMSERAKQVQARFTPEERKAKMQAIMDSRSPENKKAAGEKSGATRKAKNPSPLCNKCEVRRRRPGSWICGRCNSDQSTMRILGLTLEQFTIIFPLGCVRTCSLCGVTEERTKIAIDHDHATNIIRGPVCSACNFLLAHYERILQTTNSDVQVVSERLAGLENASPFFAWSSRMIKWIAGDNMRIQPGRAPCPRKPRQGSGQGSST